MTMKLALPLLALLPGACAAKPEPAAIPAVAERRLCPAYPLPPKELLKAPVKTDFLQQRP